MTVDEALALIERINEDAHTYAYESWVAAEEIDDDEQAEEQRCAASEEQQGYFREMFQALDPGTQVDIVQLCLKNEDLNEQFDTYHG